MATLSHTDFTTSPNVIRVIDDILLLKQREYSDIIDNEGNQYVDIVLEGGGVLGIALVGYLYGLEQAGIRFLCIGGASAGSIAAVLLAAFGKPQDAKSEEMIRILANMPMKSFIDGPWDVQNFIEAFIDDRGLSMFGFGALVLDNLLRDRGLNPGEIFFRWMKETLDRKGITSSQGLLEQLNALPESIRTRLGAELTPEQKVVRYALITADVTTETKVELPRMAELYWKDSDSVHPAHFVRASMSIPYFFHPYEVENIGKEYEKDDDEQYGVWLSQWNEMAGINNQDTIRSFPNNFTFIDGGVMSNFPIDVFHDSSNVPISPTFGVKLGHDERNNPTNTAFGLTGAIFNAARHCLDYEFIARNPDYKQLVHCIDTGHHNWLNFEMKNEEKIDLFLRGVKAAKAFLEKFDWSNYKRTREGIMHATRAEKRELPA